VYRALSFSNALYITYGVKEGGKYLEKGCHELQKKGINETGNMTSKDNSGHVVFRACKPRYKRTLESENSIMLSVESDVINVEPPVKRIHRALTSNRTPNARPVARPVAIQSVS
jgi:hypothetical protein